MTGPKLMSCVYALGSPFTAMPWTHRTNWSRSGRKPSVGRSTSRMATPMMNATMRVARWRPMTSGAAGDPVTLGGTGHGTQLGHRVAVGSDGLGHFLVAVEQPLQLALVDRHAGDLALELVRDIRVDRRDADAVRDALEAATVEVLEPAEVGPPGVREVLVERDLA